MSYFIKILSLLFIFLSGLICFSQTTYVPDDYFEQALIDFGYDDVLDNYVLTENISSVEFLYLNWNYNEIQDLTGLEDFISLTYLKIPDVYNITSLDVSNLTLLVELECQENPITSLDISNNPLLEVLHCGWNSLTSLDVSNNPQLSYLRCQGNNIISLDVSNNPLLERLLCSSNSLTSLDISNNPLLKELTCSNNNLSVLDVSNNPLLDDLSCGLNNISSLDVSNNPLLERLDCKYSNLSSLDVSNNPLLSILNCEQNNISSLELSNNPLLRSLHCKNNILSSLDLRNNPLMEILYCRNNELISLDFRNYNNWRVTSFDSKLNYNLYCVAVNNVSLATTNWINRDSQTYFSENCSLSTSDSEISSNLTIYPNPVLNNLNIYIHTSIQLQVVKVYSLTGNLVLESSSKKINLEQLNAGLYLMKIHTDKGVITKKILKK